MRITSSMYYENLYGSNNSKLNKELFDVNKQIASGLKIQYASDNISIFTQTMLLDNEITTLDQTKKSTQSGYKVADQSDVVLNEFTDNVNRMRTLLLQASNGTNDFSSQDAIAKEMRGIETNLQSLANTSINGQFLFSGSAVNIKPISSDGTYNGNAVALNAFAGSNNPLKYNITGAELFLGEESLIGKEVTSNVVQKANIGDTLDASTTIENLMGVVPVGRKHNFYLRGTKSDGTSINEQIQLDSTDTVDSLLTAIGKKYGNSGAVDIVNVKMDNNGNIAVADKLLGSSKLDFHLVGASDFGGTDESNVTSIDALETNGGVTSYATATSTAPNLYIREFNKSSYTSATGAPTTEGLVYDRTMFNVSGSKVSSDVAQIVNADNSFALPSTKLLDVASGATLDTKQLLLKGTNVNGTAINVQVDLKSAGSTFSLDNGITNYKIFDMNTPRVAVDADKMTYQQLMDVMNMALTNQLPATTSTDTDYDAAIKLSSNAGITYLSHDGKLKFDDLQYGTTKASISLYDANSGDFTAGKASVITFNTNNALTIRDSKTDFFTTINDMVTTVENHINLPDSTVGNSRSVGIEHAIAQMDDLQDHIFRTQATAGAQSNTLSKAIERVDILNVTTQSLRSSVVDTDLAESSLRLTQLTLNYQAMLATVGKVSQLSLVNYL
jgi:flagellar hook-associated protein 3 FlgL